MSVESPQYAEVAAAAASSPIAVTTALAKVDGENQGGLTLTREHIITLKKYYEFAMGLPITQADTARWLNYDAIDKPELMPASMAELFADVRQHALGWSPLSDECKSLAHILGSTAREIDTTCTLVLKYAEDFRKRYSSKADWHDVVIAQPISLGREDKVLLDDISQILEELGKVAREYQNKVQEVVKSTGKFRDTLEQQLLPKIGFKVVAVGQYKNNDKTAEVKARIAELDTDITGLQTEYANLVASSVSGLSAGVIGVAITAGIFAPKAEEARKRRNAAQEERRGLGQRLMELKRIDGAVEQLAMNIDAIKCRLQDVDMAASHLNTAWGSIEVYIAESIKQIDKIQNNKQLLKLIVHLTDFSSQWKAVEEKSVQLTKIFDDAYAA